MVGGGEPLEARAHRRLAEDEPDPRAPAPVRPSASGSSRSSRRPDGLDSARTAVAVPSPRLRRSSPRRAWSGPSAPPSSRWTKPRTRRNASSNASHGLRSRHCVARRQPDVAADDRAGCRSGPARASGGWPAGSRAGRRGGARPGPGAARRSLSIRSRIAARPTSWRGVWRSSSSSTRSSAPSIGREPVAERRADRLGPDVGVEPDAGRRRRAAPGAAPSRRAGRGRPCSGSAGRPAAARPASDAALGVRTTAHDDLVDDERPAAGRAAGREQVAERDLEARLAARRRGHALERRVEVADVGRPQDDLGEHPGQRARLERDRPALAVDRGAGHPAAAAEQVGDDVAGARVELDPGGDQRGRRRRRRPLEGRKREARARASEGMARPVIGRC